MQNHQVMDVDIFAYTDYREYLAAAFQAKKDRNPVYSHRAFSRQIGVKASNHLLRIVSGDRALSLKMIPPYSRALKLDSRGSAYLECLVRLNEAKDPRTRDDAYARMCEFRGYRKAHQLDLHVGAYHQKWYIPVVYELANRRDFRADAAWICAKVTPEIGRREAAEAIKVLREIGLLKVDKNKKAERTCELVTSGAQTQAIHMFRFHRSMMSRAQSALDENSADDRDFTALTLCLDDEGMVFLKEKLATLRQELLAYSADARRRERVFQVNLQAFPMTTKKTNP